jgi:hypothetical protein
MVAKSPRWCWTARRCNGGGSSSAVREHFNLDFADQGVNGFVIGACSLES